MLVHIPQSYIEYVSSVLCLFLLIKESSAEKSAFSHLTDNQELEQQKKKKPITVDNVK